MARMMVIICGGAIVEWYYFGEVDVSRYHVANVSPRIHYSNETLPGRFADDIVNKEDFRLDYLDLLCLVVLLVVLPVGGPNKLSSFEQLVEPVDVYDVEEKACNDHDISKVLHFEPNWRIQHSVHFEPKERNRHYSHDKECKRH